MVALTDQIRIEQQTAQEILVFMHLEDKISTTFRVSECEMEENEKSKSRKPILNELYG